MNETSDIDTILDYCIENEIKTEESLSKHGLRILEYFLTRHYNIENLCTLETGGSQTTLLFSLYSDKHYVYNRRPNLAKFKRIVADSPVDKNATITYRNRSIPHKKVEAPYLDIILLNDIHSFPMNEIDFYNIVPHLKKNGTLILDNIHIPTNKNFFEYLKNDQLFHLSQVLEKTAFFTLSDHYQFSYENSHWTESGYNAVQYRGETWKEFNTALLIPFQIDFSGQLKSLNKWFERGFTCLDGKPVSHGFSCTLNLPINETVEDDLTLKIELEVFAAPQRPDAGFSVIVNYQDIQHFSFNSETIHEIEVEIKPTGSKDIQINFVNHGVVNAGTLPTIDTKKYYPFLKPNFTLRSVSLRNKSDDSTDSISSFTRREGAISSFEHAGEIIHFFVENENDSIQSFHNIGQFYEIEELELISKHVPKNSRILDVGANIGNHTIWFEKFLDAKLIMPVEPQADIVKLFKFNCLLNNITKLDELCLGIALGDSNIQGNIVIDEAFNPAGARVESGEQGNIEIAIGDEVLKKYNFDFIKIDVEGAELSVVRGLEKLIKRCRPILFVEIWDYNKEEFNAWIEEHNYKIIEEFRRYDVATNLLLMPSQKKKWLPF